jgi:hypothetical protein
MAGGGARWRPPARAAVPAKPEPFQLIVDLGTGIGSRDWLRGAGTCFALCYVATLFWPDLSAIDGAVAAPLSAIHYAEARALAIEPAARGSATGRRMAPTDAVQPLLDAPERPTVELRATLAAPGDLNGALTRAGVSQPEAAEVAGLVGGVTPVSELPAGTALELKLGRRARPSDPRPIEKLSFRATFALKVDISRAGDRLALTRVPIVVDAAPLRVQGIVGTSLYRSARAAGLPPRVVEAYIRILSTQVGMPSGLSANDRFDVVIEHRRAATGESETGQLLYVGLERANGRAVRMMPWSLGGAVQWFEASGVGRSSSTGFRMPVQGRQTSPFGYRVHPILRYRRLHTGIDFGAPPGSPIYASADGQVARAGWDGGYGNAVRLSHGGGILTLYGHMSRLAVSPGQRVVAGQVIGYVGSTGMSTGPHLHYEVHRNGQRVDPAGFRHESRSAIQGTELEAFRARMRGMLALPLGRPAGTVQSASAPMVAPIARPVPASARLAAPRPGEW